MKRRQSIKLMGIAPLLAISGIDCAAAIRATGKSSGRIAFEQKAHNVIVIMADGCGIPQWQTGLILNGGSLNIVRAAHMGLVTTNPCDTICGDAPSHCTALACGVNSYKGSVGVDANGQPQPNLFELAKKAGITTGMVSASTLLEGSVVSFVGHAKNRMQTETITAQYVDSEIDVFIGAGEDYFNHNVTGMGPNAKPDDLKLVDRTDKRNLVNELKQKGYTIARTIEDICATQNGRLAGFTAAQSMPNLDNGRDKDLFPKSFDAALNILQQNKNGFLLVATTMYPDRASHNGKIELMGKEMANLDRVIGHAMDFADANPDTLVLIVGSPEASGMTLTGGKVADGKVEAIWSQPGMGYHTGVMVPFFTYGAGANDFPNMMLNTDVFAKIKNMLNL